LTTFGEALHYGTQRIGRRDAMLLLSHLSAQPSSYIMLHEGKVFAQFEQYKKFVASRQQGQPLQYIIGQWDFMGHTFKTDKRALIPRPETELLVEEVIKFGVAGKNILDLCTGSGCIAIAIKKAVPCNVTAVDICDNALALAMENSNGLDINFIKSDLFANIDGMFDIIVSNPPYITTAEMATLEPTVSDYEPHLALHGGLDGLDIYRHLVPQSYERLHPGGALFLEIGPPAVLDIVQDAGFKDTKLLKDYAGLDRIVYGVK